MWSHINIEDQLLDLDYINREIEILKYSLEVPYIDKRARNNDLNDDLLEEVKTAFNEISNKEKTLKQVIQVLGFLLEKYSSITEDYQDANERLITAESDLKHYKRDIVGNLHSKIERSEDNLRKIEKQLVKSENEVRDLRRQLQTKKPETSVLKGMKEIEQRVRRQSEFATSHKINGLEEALKSHQNNYQELEDQIKEQQEDINRLEGQNERLEKELQALYASHDIIQNDFKSLNSIKQGLEIEFTDVVEAKENEIDKLKKELLYCKEEYERTLRSNKELELKFSRLLSKSINSVSNTEVEIQKNCDRVETSASIEDDAIKRIDEGESESDSDQEVFFGEERNYVITTGNRDTWENLADFLGNSRQSYHGDFGNDDIVDMITTRKSAYINDFVRYVDKGMQTVKDYQFNIDLNPVEEEKYSTSIQDDYSMELNSDVDTPRRINDSVLRSSVRESTRKDALEEYFKMTVLASKISHQDLDKVWQIKSSKLYQKAKHNKIPFHDWQGWIEKQLNELYLETIYLHQNNKKSLIRVSSEDMSNYSNDDAKMQRISFNNDKEQLRKFISDNKMSKSGYVPLSDNHDQNKKDKWSIF